MLEPGSALEEQVIVLAPIGVGVAEQGHAGHVRIVRREMACHAATMGPLDGPIV
jgi:hypothetical protein